MNKLITSRFGRLNSFWHNIEEFRQSDKHLRDLRTQKYVYTSPWLDEVVHPGVYLFFGGRQVGKTTSLKQCILRALEEKKVLPEATFYLPCDTLVDRTELEEILRGFIEEVPKEQLSLLVIDEITFINQWQLTVKGLIDQGLFEKTILLITGSDRVVLEDAASGFPGIHRRGRYGKDFIIHPLTFHEYCNLVSKEEEHTENLDGLFLTYLQTGGYLPAINAVAMEGSISDQLYAVYEQWIVGDIVRKGKDRRRFTDLLRVLHQSYGSQLSYSGIAQKAQHLSTDTVIEYVDYLERLGFLIVLQAFDQNTLSAFPKKDKRIYVRDPFLLSVMEHFLLQQGVIAERERVVESYRVETAVIGCFEANNNKLYYIKAEGEVDLVEVHQGTFTAIEVKWTEQLRNADLKQILKYPKEGIILAKNPKVKEVEGVQVKGLVEYLRELTPKAHAK